MSYFLKDSVIDVRTEKGDRDGEDDDGCEVPFEKYNICFVNIRIKRICSWEQTPVWQY